jgi:hypothetical protein
LLCELPFNGAKGLLFVPILFLLFVCIQGARKRSNFASFFALPFLVHRSCNPFASQGKKEAKGKSKAKKRQKLHKQ